MVTLFAIWNFYLYLSIMIKLLLLSVLSLLDNMIVSSFELGFLMERKIFLYGNKDDEGFSSTKGL